MYVYITMRTVFSLNEKTYFMVAWVEAAVQN